MTIGRAKLSKNLVCKCNRLILIRQKNKLFFYVFKTSIRNQHAVYQHTSAMFAYDDLFIQTDIQLTLRRYFIVTSTASITLYCNNSKTVTRVSADPFISIQQTVFDSCRSFFT